MKNLLFLLLAVVLLCGCKDRKQDEDTLPPATQEGKNTGGALVDGKVWVAKIEWPDLTPSGNNTTYSFVNNQHKLSIILRHLENTSSNSIKIYITTSQEILSGSTYQLINDYENRGIYSVIPISTYYTNISNTGQVTITRFDKVNKIASGTFSFKAVNSSGQTVTVTEGRFDKKFIQ